MQTQERSVSPTGTEESFFTAIGNTKPFFKAAFEGEPGTGKSWTAALVAIGLHKKINSKKPIVLIDTEKASKFLVPLFREHGIEAMVRETHSLADLVKAMKLSVGAQITTAQLTPATLGWGIVLSIGAAACRAAIKAVIEGFSGTTGDPQVG